MKTQRKSPQFRMLLAISLQTADFRLLKNRSNWGGFFMGESFV
jgi:hypothetical protein